MGNQFAAGHRESPTGTRGHSEHKMRRTGSFSDSFSPLSPSNRRRRPCFTHQRSSCRVAGRDILGLCPRHERRQVSNDERPSQTERAQGSPLPQTLWRPHHIGYRLQVLEECRIVDPGPLVNDIHHHEPPPLPQATSIVPFPVWVGAVDSQPSHFSTTPTIQDEHPGTP